MSDYECYEEMVPRLKKMEFRRVREPDMPLHVAVHEGEVFRVLASQDSHLFENVGLDPSIIEELRRAVACFAVADAKYAAVRELKKEAVRVWLEEQKAGFELRRQCLVAQSFAFRNNSEAKGKLRSIRRMRGRAAMIQDLRNLAQLGITYKDELTAINFDMNRLALCEETADRLGRLWAEAFSSESRSEEIVIRNKAFTYMRMLMAQIREYVKYVFHDDPDRQRQYASAYRRSHYRGKKAQEERQEVIEQSSEEQHEEVFVEGQQKSYSAEDAGSGEQLSLFSQSRKGTSPPPS